MYRFINTYTKLFSLAFVLGFAIPSGVNSALISANISDYDGLTHEEALVQYHLLVDVKTNEYIDVLVTSEDPHVVYPKNPDDCGSSNVSTYCLALELNDYLVELETVLSSMKDELRFDELDAEDLPSLFSEGLEFRATKTSIIEDEVELARDALDLTLAVYNQIQIVYPVHRELENFYKKDGTLDLFRENLADVRDKVALYPSTFLDATTNECE